MPTRVVQAVLASRPVGAAWRACTRGSLRVLAYHSVGDVDRFEAQLQHLTRHYSPVGSAQVLRWLHDGAPLPPMAVWVTFDDGVEDVVRLGLPLLQRYRVPATLFVCPGLIDTDRLHWWEAVERAGSQGLLPSTADELRALKALDDTDRRRAVAAIEDRLRATPAGATGAQLTTADLRAWLAAGNDLGNHSLDHPRLDRCSPGEQEQQVRRAHDWLTGFLGAPPVLFAWPNGDAAEPALAVLRSLGYRAVLVCDHRLTRRGADPMALSRVRIDADDSVPRLRSVVSGAHPGVFALTRR